MPLKILLTVLWVTSSKQFSLRRHSSLNQVSMEDAVKLSTQIRWYSPLWAIELCYAERRHYRSTRFSAFRLSSLQPRERGFKRQTFCQGLGMENCFNDVDRKNSLVNVTRQGYIHSLQGATLLLRETLTMLGSKDVIHREPVLFLCMIHVPVSVTISVLKKKVLLFPSS